MTNTTGPQFVLGGRRDGTSLSYQGTRGHYWSSSAWTSATSARNLLLNGTDSTVLPANYSNKYRGFSLRCLGNTTGEFQSLYNQYPTYDQMRKYPVGMVLGGWYLWSDGSLNYQGSFAGYWSCSAEATRPNRAHRLRLYLDMASPAGDEYKYVSFSLRRLAPLH